MNETPLLLTRAEVAEALVEWLEKEANYPWTTVEELAADARCARLEGRFPWERDGNGGSE